MMLVDGVAEKRCRDQVAVRVEDVDANLNRQIRNLLGIKFIDESDQNDRRRIEESGGCGPGDEDLAPGEGRGRTGPSVRKASEQAENSNCQH